MNASFEQNFVGIDVSKGTLDLAVRGQSRTVQFGNTPEGISGMLKHLKCIEGNRIFKRHIKKGRRSAAWAVRRLCG